MISQKLVAQSLQYGDQKIPYSVNFQSEATRKLSIHVLPSGAVRVDAPLDASLAEIKRAVAKRARWLNDLTGKIRERRVHVLPREYVSGESHLYMGRRYLLKVRAVQQIEPSVKLRQGRFDITTRDRDPDVVRSLLTDWYRSRARNTFGERLSLMSARLPWLKLPPRWKLLSMKRQWGSCSPSGVISLNPSLIKAPSACIDYVLLHELCHLKHHNHSRYFYRLMDRQMPGWPAVKDRLDGMAELVLVCRGTVQEL
jgi:predicted metal-dependent hydrolase